MSNIIPANFGQLSKRFQQAEVVDDLSSGIQSSFGLIGYKGKVWSIRYRGNETPLMRDDGDGPRGSIEVVILKASQHISKIWYEHGYVEGSNSAPDCYSNNGVAPEPTSAKRQSDTCALCPHNQWGSRVTPAGKQGKACSDSKRLAVVPDVDILNESFGGPMLLRVPAASLQDLAHYGQKMKQMGYPYYAVATRIKFDPAEAYPKFLFGAIRPLSDEEAEAVLSIRDGHLASRILSENEFAADATTKAEPEPEPEQIFEQPPEKAKAAAKPTAAAKPKAEVQEAKKSAPEAGAKPNPFAAAAKASSGNVSGEVTPLRPSDEGTVENPQEGEDPASYAEEVEAPAPKKAEPKKTATKKAAPVQEVEPEQEEEQEEERVASGFELDLDAELEKLLG